MSYFHPLEVVGRGSETQIQVSENVNKLTQRDKGQIKKRDVFNFMSNPERHVQFHGALSQDITMGTAEVTNGDAICQSPW